MTIDVILDFIDLLSNFNCGQVMAFVDILVNILDSLYGGANFYIDVTVVTCREIRIMGNNITIGEDMIDMGFGVGPTIVG
jgi:hypothetical protein